MFISFIMSQDYWLVYSFDISWLIQGCHSSILKWNHFSASNETIILTGIPTIKSSCLLGLFIANGLGPLSIQVLCPTNNHRKNIQGTQIAQDRCLLASKTFISTWLLIVPLDCITQILHYHILYSISSFSPIRTSLFSTRDLMVRSFRFLFKLINKKSHNCSPSNLPRS